jgi:hypothetical protein
LPTLVWCLSLAAHDVNAALGPRGGRFKPAAAPSRLLQQTRILTAASSDVMTNDDGIVK